MQEKKLNVKRNEITKRKRVSIYNKNNYPLST